MEAADSRAEMGEFLATLYADDCVFSATARPRITLSYAQSLDGMIGGVDGRQIILSGTEAMLLTHRLREVHEGIMVGIGTILADDPQLTVRLPTLLPLHSQPVPIILDTHLRTPTSCKLFVNAAASVSHRPLIFHAEPAFEDEQASLGHPLAAAGAQLVYLAPDASGRLPLEKVVHRLGLLGYRSIMVEGGAAVIDAVMRDGLVDILVVTVAPVLIGEGVRLFQNQIETPTLQHVKTLVLGRDAVIVCRTKQE